MPETEIQSRPGNEAISSAVPRVSTGFCPFREGPETLDMLLAEIGIADTALLDVALDLRSAAMAQTDAAAALHELYRLRALLDGRHYLAFYRVRCWIHRLIHAEARPWRGAPWEPVALPRDCARLDAAVNTCLASQAAMLGGWYDTARVRFRFASDLEQNLPRSLA